MNQEDHTKLAVLQNDVDGIKKTIDRYETNHFPTIERRFDTLEKKLAVYAAMIIIGAGVLEFVAQTASNAIGNFLAK